MDEIKTGYISITVTQSMSTPVTYVGAIQPKLRKRFGYGDGDSREYEDCWNAVASYGSGDGAGGGLGTGFESYGKASCDKSKMGSGFGVKE